MPRMNSGHVFSLKAAAAGGCLCGSVRFEVSAGEVAESGYCHCRTCQKQSGSPAVAWFAVAPSRLTITLGAAAKYRASPRATREFCGGCGTYLFFREDDPEATVSVNTATLDDPARVPPAFHIYHDSRIAWFETADALPRYARGRE